MTMTGDRMLPVAERDRLAAEIEPDHAPGLEVARDIGRAAAAPAADLEHVAADQRRQRRDMAVKRDGIALRLVLGVQVERAARATHLSSRDPRAGAPVACASPVPTAASSLTPDP